MRGKETGAEVRTLSIPVDHMEGFCTCGLSFLQIIWLGGQLHESISCYWKIVPSIQKLGDIHKQENFQTLV